MTFALSTGSVYSISDRNNRTEITTAFNKLLQHYEKKSWQIATKEQEIAKTNNEALLVKTSDYTVSNIVNGMASLQLNFGNVVGQLAEELASESNKLAELKKAIAIETEHLERLKQVRLVADALYILEREQQAKKADAETKTANTKEEIAKETALIRREWEIEQREFTTKVREAAELTIKQRQQEVADYQYELERQRTIEQDEYETDKRLQAIEIAEQETVKGKNWSKREKYLAEHQGEFKQHQEAIANFETKFKEEYDRARVKAIKETDSKQKVAAELKEKEWLAIERGYELKIASLTTIVERQNERISEMAVQLQDANTQAQNLAMQAFRTVNSEQ